MASPFLLSLHLVSLITSVILIDITLGLKNGDTFEFYISAKNLPRTNGGTGTYRYAFVIGTLWTGGRQSWKSPVYSNVITGSNPIWSANLHNITHEDVYVPEINFGHWGNYKIAFFEKMSNGEEKLLMGLWHWDINVIKYVARSCETLVPWEENYDLLPYYNYTYYYHCTRCLTCEYPTTTTTIFPTTGKSKSTVVTLVIPPGFLLFFQVLWIVDFNVFLYS